MYVTEHTYYNHYYQYYYVVAVVEVFCNIKSNIFLLINYEGLRTWLLPQAFMLMKAKTSQPWCK